MSVDRARARSAPGGETFQPFWRKKDNKPDRPGIQLIPVKNPDAKRIVGDFTEAPVSPVRESRRGATYGGGMSKEARRRTRRRAAANGS